MALTKRTIDALGYDPSGPRVQIAYDGGDIPGFGVRVHPTGRKTFVLTYRPRGNPRPKRVTLGTYGVMTLDEARKVARQTLLQAKTGEDPLERRRKERTGDTVRDLARRYLTDHASRHKRTWKEDERRLEKYILPTLGGRKIKDITVTDVGRLHNRIGRRAPYEANRVLALLSVMFKHAANWGLMEPGTPNPAHGIRKFSETSRDRWVKPEEMPALVQAIDAEPSPYVRAAIKLYLLTGMRRNELLNLRWRDVDLNRREIRLERTKANRPHIVPLSAEAVAILEALPRGIGNAPVFPGEDPSKPLVNISKPWNRIRARFWLARNPDEAARLRKQAERDVARRPKHAEKGPEAVEARLLQLAHRVNKGGSEDVRLHDLRRTVGSWLATSGASLPLIGKILNHSTVEATKIYARLADETARKALEAHGARIGPLLLGEVAE